MDFLSKRLMKKPGLRIFFAVIILLTVSIGTVVYYLSGCQRYYSAAALKNVITASARRNHIEISFSVPGGYRWWWRPTLTLTGVKAKQINNNYQIDFTAEKVEIAFSYTAFFTKQPQPYRLRFLKAAALVTPRIAAAVSARSTLPAASLPISLPKYITFYDSMLTITGTQSGKRRQWRHLVGNLQTLKSGRHWLELNGETDYFTKPLTFTAAGFFLINNRQLLADDIKFNFIFRSGHNLYQTQATTNLIWDFKQKKALFGQLSLFSKEYSRNITVQGLIAAATYQSHTGISVPKARLDISGGATRSKIQGYIDLNNLNCRQDRCSVRRAGFGGNYSFYARNFVLNGSGTVNFSLINNDLIGDKLIINFKNISKEGAIPLWNLNLKGAVYAAAATGLHGQLTGFLDNHALTFKFERQPYPNNPWRGQIDLAAFDIRPYFEAEGNEKSAALYNNLFSKMPLLTAFLATKKIDIAFKIHYLQLPLINLSEISGRLLYHDPLLKLRQVTGKIFEGSFLTNITYRAYPYPAWQVEHKLRRVNIGLMLFYFVNYPYLAGSGNAFFTFHTRGIKVGEMLANLSGFSSLEIRRGNILGYDWRQLIHYQPQLNSAADHIAVINSNFTQNRFDLFKNITYWSEGKGETAALELSGPDFSVAGSGKTDLMAKTLDFSLLLRGKTEGGQDEPPVNLPLHIVGNLFDPEYYIDYKQMIRVLDAAGNKEQVLKDFIKQQLQLIY